MDKATRSQIPAPRVLHPTLGGIQEFEKQGAPRLRFVCGTPVHCPMRCDPQTAQHQPQVVPDLPKQAPPFSFRDQFDHVN